MKNSIRLFLIPICIIFNAVFHAYAGQDVAGECFVDFENAADSAMFDPDMDFYHRFELDAATSKKNPDRNIGLCLAGLSDAWDTMGAEILFVDIGGGRSGVDPGVTNAVNIPLHELRTKQYLKKKRIFLLDEYFRYFELIQECMFLRSIGFEYVSIPSLDIIDGLSGGVPGGHDYKLIGPEKFSALKQKWQWIIFDFAGDSYNYESDNIVRLNESVGKKSMRDTFGRYIEKAHVKNGFYPHVLIVDKDGSAYRSIRSIVPDAHKTRVFYLKDGIAGYRDFTVRQHMMLAQGGRSYSGGRAPCGISN